MSKLDSAKRDLELAHTGMTSELHKQWAAEDEILNLQNALDESEIKVQDAKAEIVRLNKKIQDKVTIDQKLESQFEQLSVNYINAQAELELKNEELGKVKRNLAKKTESVKVAEMEIKAKKELEKKIQHLEEDLEIKVKELSSLNISLSTQQKLIQEQEKEVAKIKYQLNQAEKSACKMDEMQSKMVDQEDEIQTLKTSQQSHEKELQDKDKVIQILRQELDPLQENAQSYKEKYESLSRLVEPFR